MQNFAQQPPSLVLLESCGSAHHWARELQRFGHTVRLLPPHDVHRYVRRNKTDRTDAKALLEAHRNEEIHAVTVKSVDQQATKAEPSLPINERPLSNALLLLDGGVQIRLLDS